MWYIRISDRMLSRKEMRAILERFFGIVEHCIETVNSKECATDGERTENDRMSRFPTRCLDEISSDFDHDTHRKSIVSSARTR